MLGLDYGERRIGVALSDPLRMTAQPHSVIDLTTDDLATRLAEIMAQGDVDEVVVGLPVSLSGDEGPSAVAARRFGQDVAEITGLAVTYQNEQFSSVVAERALLEGGKSRQDRREMRDKVAAAVLLQDYLDTQS